MFEPANIPMRLRCEENFVAQEVYRIEFRDERSAVSHRHYFACIHEAWRNLPEALANRFPSSEDLRGHALIKAGYADHFDLVDETDIAIALARQIRRLGRYAIVVPRGNMHRIYVAQSQSVRAMDSKVFQASKTAVLNEIADLIGVTLADLASNAAQGDHHPEVARTAPDLTAGEPSHDPPQDADRPKPMRQRPAMQETPPSPAVSLTGTAGDTPAVRHSGGSTPDGSSGQPLSPPAPAGAGGSEQKNPGGGDIPTTPEEYERYLRAWLSYVKDAGRITQRFANERAALWPKLKPMPTLKERSRFNDFVLDAIAQI